MRSERAARGRRSRTAAAGVVLLVVGSLLLASAGAYYGYGLYASSRLDDLAFSAEDFRPSQPSPAGSVSDAEEFYPPPLLPHVERTFPDSPPGWHDQTNGTRVRPADPAFPLSAYVSIYPGLQLHPKYWDQPLWAGTDVVPDPGLPEGYRRLTRFDLMRSNEALGGAKRIRIPVINVDSTVKELRILDLGDSRAYETPNNVVGHIPETSNPGQTGTGWYFGHLESPIRGEGNVFRRLPEIGRHIENGDPVYISLVSDDGEFLYRVTAGNVVHQDELALYVSDEAIITLVTCVPKWTYDNRLLVTGRLVGVKI